IILTYDSAPISNEMTTPINPEADAVKKDYDLSQPLDTSSGLRQGLTSYGDAYFSLFLRKVSIKALGYSEDALPRPIIGIINTNSGFNPCHGNAPQLIEAAKRGVYLNGGITIEFPTISLHEGFSHPTSMFLRTLMSMDTEEMIKAQPVDACIMIGGCDKTVPAQIMGGISANKPILPLITGPMMPGSNRGKRIGACTDCRNNWASFRAGTIDMEEIMGINEELAPTGASAPAVSAARLRIAEQTGANAVAAAKAQRTPQAILSAESFYNAAIVLQAISGSTNAMVDLMAVVNRHPELNGNFKWNVMSAQPFAPVAPPQPQTITGETLGEVLDRSNFRDIEYSRSIIRTLSDPLYPCSSLAVVRGNIAPNGAVIKASASREKSLHHHRGKAMVFENSKDLALRLDDPGLEVIADSVLVLKGIGLIGNPGMPDAGMIPIPRKLAKQGVTDMLRLSDGRMSGTAGGTILLHVSPESGIPDSPFGVVQNRDKIELDLTNQSLELLISEEELRQGITLQKERLTVANEGTEPSVWLERETCRGYRGLYERTVNQSHDGAYFDVLTATGPKK
ncbi:dihydroxy-acid and 6-phosphogluconate dehydratase, partial [Penicillium malachiteum]|uniref:dihydroxy-acid and 6-phosphogluconate dehydratase n=1 Tax=Penicillium malachiteum TaxID=1324776 RepID=UPI00254788E5